jgi:2-(1,2-epoxy-1,2-dihydrophenyl)acetyl-CoA isomerase
MPYEQLIFTKENGVAWAKFNRPEVMNALSQELHIELHEAIREVREDNEVRVMVITGIGRAFAAGRDVTQQADRVHQREQGQGFPPTRETTRPSGSPWDIGIDLWTLPKPVIAAVNGVAVGGGFSFVLESDIILASENATFGEFFVRRGYVSSGQGQWLLPRLIGPHRAKEMLMMGELIDARQAEKWGLVNHVYPADEFEDRVKEFAEKLARGPAGAISQIKKLVNDGLSMGMESVGRAEQQADSFLMAAHFEDHREGVLSFIEKRAPHFKGAPGPRTWSKAGYK